MILSFLKFLAYHILLFSSEQGADLDNIMWLTLDNIGEGGEECRVPGPAGLVGSGKAVGGVVSKVGRNRGKVFFPTPRKTRQ